ncbi:MFS transporter [Streptomyces glomeratus]|uniref:Major facilitator superfamily (MFS) profile domain-containing protein n=1 Tax=Streptomyces glomeratus TaxID=284452 RepID=A0ABP6M635_9ACTN|nr:MFS transporter [Streptomyces glomeratus]MCF1511881.1 MFS transporter [Streptomyces glomeratus]
MTETQRRIGFLVCLVTIVLALLDLQIVSAATVPIVRDLDPDHGIEAIPWLVSAYALASAAMLPLYGKLCDVLGPKRVFTGAIATFLLGSALCGAAQSMGQLIAARALQGLGGGGLMSVTMVVIAHLKSPQEKGSDKRGNIGGLVAGGAMAIGPWIGGLLADHANWRWIFYVNLPIGIAVLAASALALKLPGSPVRRPIDYTGAALAAAFSSTLLLVTDWGGKRYPWSSPVVLGLVLAAALTLALFLWRQLRAPEPVLPLSLFAVRELRLGFAVQAILGSAMMCTIYYVLIYLQVARGIASSSAGLYLVPMAVGLTGVGLLSGRLTARGWSARTFTVSGTATTALALLAATTGPHTSLWWIRGELLLTGAGFGQLVGQLILLVQNSAPRHQLGVATTSVRFFQTLGNALGTAAFGTVLARVYAAHGPGGDVGALAARPGGAHHAAGVHAFVEATQVVFWSGAGLMGLAALLALRLPKSAGQNGASAPARQSQPVSA